MRVASFKLAAPVITLSLALAACVESPTAPAGRGGEARAEDAGSARTSPSATRPHFVKADPGDVKEVLARATAAARADGCMLVAYVGASWCEPCVAFHHAVEGGQLDAALARTRFLEFDADVDGERLDAAGYGGRFIPRFVVPTDAGEPSAHALEGGIKGDGAVEHIMKRLGPLLARARSVTP